MFVDQVNGYHVHVHYKSSNLEILTVIIVKLLSIETKEILCAQPNAWYTTCRLPRGMTRASC